MAARHYVPPSTINACVVDLNVQSVQMLLYALSVLNVHSYECVCENECQEEQ